MSTTHIQVAGLVGAPPEAVWEALADHCAWPEWVVHPDGKSGLRRMEVLQAVPGGVGTRRRSTFVVGGQEQGAWEELIVEWQPGHALGYVSVGQSAGLRWWRGRLTLTPNGAAGRSTLVEWHVRYEPSGWYEALRHAVFLRRMIAACMEHGLQQLEARLGGAAPVALASAETDAAQAGTAMGARTVATAAVAAEGAAG